MLLASEFSKFCIVTDGDGQYPLESIQKLKSKISKNTHDVVIPQRINKKILIEYNNMFLNREQFELLETLCALDIIKNTKLNYDLDAQPGMFGFRSSRIQDIIPKNSGWLTDFEITVNAILKTNYCFLSLYIDEFAQEITTFSIKDQIEKFKRLIEIHNLDLNIIFKNNKNLFKNPEKELIEKILKELYHKED